MYYLDTQALARLTRAQRGSRGLREVAREIGNVSPSTLSRVENGQMPDIETFLLLCDWLKVPPSVLIKNSEDSQPSRTELETSEALAIQLRADKNLDPTTANILAIFIKAAYDNFACSKDYREFKEAKERSDREGTVDWERVKKDLDDLEEEGVKAP